MRFYGQFEPQVDEFIFERYFRDTNIKGFFVECGAFDGLLESSCKFFEETCGWDGLNLEPAPAVFERLEANRPSSRNLKLALSSSSGTAQFRHAISPLIGEVFGNGSLSHNEEHLKDLKERGCTFVDFEVQTITWSELMEREDVPEVDLFVLDVEGHELDVIEGMHGAKTLPKLICVEFGHIGFSKLRVALSALGYEYDIHSTANAFFIHRDALPLFAMRCSRTTELTASPSADNGTRVRELEEHINSIQESLSWRITKPLRFLRRL